MSHIDLEKLKWIKVIHDPTQWAYSHQHLESMTPKAHPTDITIFPLGFRTDNAKKLEATDRVTLIQNGKLTHLVEIIDSKPYEAGGWYHRLCRILWWKPEIADWGILPPQKELLGFDPALQNGAPSIIEGLRRFDERWDENGKMAGLRAFLSEKLAKI